MPLPAYSSKGKTSLWWIWTVASIVGITGAFCLIIFSPEIFDIKRPIPLSQASKHVRHWKSKLKFGSCRLPQLNPYGDEVLMHVKQTQPINCVKTSNSSGKRVFEVIPGTRILRRISYGFKYCCYQPFYRVDDMNERASQNCYEIKNRTTVIPVEHEFIEVFCHGEQEGYKYHSDGFAIVSKDKLEHKTSAVKTKVGSGNPQDLNKLNVVILGIDATSRMNFLRKMPKSHDYLIHNLSAVEMKGYNKVAENTLPNVVPLLTGMTLEEMKQKCIPSGTTGEYVRIDTCPFVWHAFSVNGYKTSFAEDDVDIAIFNMDWRLAFEHPPTDFYLRPFTTLMQRKHLSGFNQCLGTRLSFKVLLDNIENFATAMHNFSSYFQFTWATKMSHDDINKLGLGDDPLLETLEFLNDNGHLNNTALFVMSDHGSRWDDGIRSTAQGKLEDRMPLLYIVLPPWFKTQFPLAWENININSGRIMSAFDIHETFKELMDLKRTNVPVMNPQNKTSDNLRRPSSLFQLLPPNRTCADAGIPMHWCICFQKNPLPKDSKNVKAGAEIAVEYLNRALRLQTKCSTLSLSKVTESFELNKQQITWYWEDQKTSNKSAAEANGDFQVVHVTFETKPGDAMFEVTLIHVNAEWEITEKPARINAYEGQSHCVLQEYKPYCYCKPKRNKRRFPFFGLYDQ